jgi:hypothetical protein
VLGDNFEQSGLAFRADQDSEGGRDAYRQPGQRNLPASRERVSGTRGRERHPEASTEDRGNGTRNSDCPEGAIEQDVCPDALDGADDERDHRYLHADEDRSQCRLADVDGEVQPGEREHQHEPRQHETQSRQESPGPAARQHADVHTKFVRLRPWQHLVDGKKAIETAAREPALLVDEVAPDHGDLGDRPTPCEQPEAQEADEYLPMGKSGRGMAGLLGLAAGRGRGGRQIAHLPAPGFADGQLCVSSVASRHHR